MSKQANQPREEKNRDFGLPQAEFKPIADKGKKWLKVTAIIVGIVLFIGAGVVYWFFSHAPAAEPSEEAYPMHEEYESEVPNADVDFIEDDASATHQAPVEAKQDTQTHELDKELEALEEDTKAFNPPTTAKPEKGTITKINTPQGRYYVIVGSFIDDDLASDYANQLANQGVEVMLIAPPQGKHFFHVAVDQEDSAYDANEKAAALKATYGQDIWVMKY